MAGPFWSLAGHTGLQTPCQQETRYFIGFSEGRAEACGNLCRFRCAATGNLNHSLTTFERRCAFKSWGTRMAKADKEPVDDEEPKDGEDGTAGDAASLGFVKRLLS